MGEALLPRMAQRGGEAAQRPGPRFRPIGDAGEAPLLAPAYHQRLALGEERRSDPVDQPHARVERLRLVAPEPPRLSAGEDGAKESQSNASLATPWSL